jgi:hypothetical protein
VSIDIVTPLEFIVAASITTSHLISFVSSAPTRMAPTAPMREGEHHHQDQRTVAYTQRGRDVSAVEPLAGLFSAVVLLVCSSPRTPCAGFVWPISPVTSQSNIMRIAARRC